MAERRAEKTIMLATLVLELFLLSAAACTGYAAGPGEPTQSAVEANASAERENGENTVSEAEEEAAAAARAAAALSDNVLRYEELQDAVHNGNPTVAEAVKNYNDRLAQYQEVLDELTFYQRDAGTERHNALDNKDRELAASWKQEYNTYSNSAKMYRDMYESMTSYASQRSLRQVERQMTVAAQSLMISYESLRHQRDTAEKEVSLRQRQAENTRVKQTAGLASAVDVLDAESALLIAQSRLAALEDSLQSVYRNLCYAVGRDDDGSLIIAEMPVPDAARIAAMNLEADTWKAIGNNVTLISQRRQNGGMASNTTAVRLRTNAESEQKLTAKMASLYEDVLQKQQEYESARTAFAAARETKRISDLRAAAGLIGIEEQLSAEMSFLSAEASFKAVELAFTQAMDTYDWAVIGITALE